jgi:gliding motility-associated-like protein
MNKIIRFFFLLIAFSLHAQNETSNWYFGNKAALKFENGRLITLDDSAMDAPAGSASISNANGELLFYSNGATVWNRNHQIMENGSGLAGDTNSFQSTIIIPKPGDENTYFLFYSRTENSNSPLATAGSFYAEINFSSAFPLGRVTAKNVLLSTSSPSEKITAVHHKNGDSFWLVTLHGEDVDKEKPKKIFKVYQIDATGIIRPALETIAEKDIESLGAMKLSSDGKKLIITSNTSDDNLRYVHQYDFNNETGELTFVTRRIVDYVLKNWPLKGIEFSPNGKFIYLSYKIGNNNGIMQFELGDIGVSVEPRTILHIENTLKIESLQIGNDQKIYVALHDEEEGNDFLGVIENPNEKGTLANYRHNAIRLSPKTSKRGLPNFIQSYFASKISTQNVCYTEEFSFSASSFGPVTNVSWDFRDGTLATGINATHTFSSPGNYSVKAILTVGSHNITVYKLVRAYELPVLNPNQELVECDEDLDGLSTFNLLNIREKILSRSSTDSIAFYLSPVAISSDTKIINPENFQNTVPNQQIFIKVTNENGCSQTSSFLVRTRFVQLGNIADVFVCEDSDGIVGNAQGEFDTLTLQTSIRNQLGLASSLRLSFYPTFTEAQMSTNRFTGSFNETSKIIFVKIVEADLSCGGIKGFNIIVNSEAKINLEEVYTICFNPLSKTPVIVSADATNDSFEWRDSSRNILSTSQNFTLTTVGEFSLTVYKAENNIRCSNTKSFQVVNPNPAKFSQVIVNTEDETNNIVDVFINGNSSYEFSLDNINFLGNGTSFTFTKVAAGLRTVFVRDINSCEEPIQITVSVIGYQKYFTPNGDGKNDYWNIKGLDSGSFKSINVSIFDRYGRVISTITDFISSGWDGSFNGKSLPSNDYWYTAILIDVNGNVIKKNGHFSLVR